MNAGIQTAEVALPNGKCYRIECYNTPAEAPDLKRGFHGRDREIDVLLVYEVTKNLETRNPEAKGTGINNHEAKSPGIRDTGSGKPEILVSGNKDTCVQEHRIMDISDTLRRELIDEIIYGDIFADRGIG